MRLSVFALREFIGVAVATCPGRLLMISRRIFRDRGVAFLPGNFRQDQGFWRRIARQVSSPVPLLPLQLLRDPLTQAR